jgi:chaperonin cofactor prefoldin
MEENEDQMMTVTQLGARVSHLDGEVKTLRDDMTDVKTTTAGTAAVAEALRGDMTVLFGKMDRMAERGNAGHATKGMIPISYVTWGVGVMVSLLSVGLTVLGISAAVVIWAQTSGDAKVAKDVAKNTAEINENEVDLDYLDKWREKWLIDWGVLKTELETLKSHDISDVGGHDDTIRRIALLEEQLKWARQEIDDHKDKADHPLLQNEQLKSLQQRLQDAKTEIERIDSEGPRRWNSAPSGPSHE